MDYEHPPSVGTRISPILFMESDSLRLGMTTMFGSGSTKDGDCCDYICTHVDDFMIIGKDLKAIMEILD